MFRKTALVSYSIQIITDQGAVLSKEVQDLQAGQYQLSAPNQEGVSSGELTPDMLAIVKAHHEETRQTILPSEAVTKIATQNQIPRPPEWP